MKISMMAKGLFSWLVLSLLLAACGDATTPTAAPAAQAGPVDLNIQLYPANPATGGPPATWEVFETIKTKLNINLKYTMTPLDPDGANKLNALAASNDLPDF